VTGSIERKSFAAKNERLNVNRLNIRLLRRHFQLLLKQVTTTLRFQGIRFRETLVTYTGSRILFKWVSLASNMSPFKKKVKRGTTTTSELTNRHTSKNKHFS